IEEILVQVFRDSRGPLVHVEGRAAPAHYDHEREKLKRRLAYFSVPVDVSVVPEPWKLCGVFIAQIYLVLGTNIRVCDFNLYYILKILASVFLVSFRYEETEKKFCVVLKVDCVWTNPSDLGCIGSW
ncbi:hypothetical protein C0J52_28121, partial [Blattella germanica]